MEPVEHLDPEGFLKEGLKGSGDREKIGSAGSQRG
jgi:hypothetical protein